MPIAVDFDGTIHDAAHPCPGKRMGPPIEGAKDALTFLIRYYEIVVFCYWADSDRNREVIQKWMEYYQIPFTKITNIKPKASAYIDDKAIEFTDWPSALKVLGAKGIVES